MRACDANFDLAFSSQQYTNNILMRKFEADLVC